MAFGLKREELKAWKNRVSNGNIGIITHYWMDERFPDCYTVTKVGCSDIQKLKEWGQKFGLNPEWIHKDERYPHYDLFGRYQKEVLLKENKLGQIKRFNL